MASKLAFITHKKTKNKIKCCQALCLHSFSKTTTQCGDSAGIQSLSLSPFPRSVGRVSLVSPQSLELDTGVSHYSLDLLITTRLHTRSPRAALRLPTALSPQYIYLKRGLWTTDNSPDLFLFSQGKMLLTLFLFEKWLGGPFPEDVWAWWLLMHWLQLQFTPCEALPSVWIGFTWSYSLACGHPCCLCTFSYPISSFQSTLHLICFVTALHEQPPFSNDPLWLTLFVEGVNDRLLDHCQVIRYPEFIL